MLCSIFLTSGMLMFLLFYVNNAVVNEQALKNFGENDVSDNSVFLEFNKSNKKNKYPFRKSQHKFIKNSREYKIQKQLGYKNDPYWTEEWYLNEEKLKIDNEIFQPSMKIANMHFNKNKGQSVAVVIVGNSKVNFEHSDFSEGRFKWNQNELSFYSKPKSSSFFNKRKTQVYESEIETAVAGIIGMKDQNLYCGVGILPRCKLGSIVIAEDSAKGFPEYCITEVIKRNPILVDIFVHVWKLAKYDPAKDILHLMHRENLLSQFYKNAMVKPQVMGSGDHGIIGNTCQCNEYANLDSMFVFGSVQYNGYIAPYSETGASIIAVTFSTSNGDEYYNNLITVDNVSNTMTKRVPKYTTAASAAIGAGIIGLFVDYFKEKYEKPPTISDITFLLAFSSDNEYMQYKDTLWFKNGVNLSYSLQAGFGIPNMLKAVHLMDRWTSISTPIDYKVSFLSLGLDFKCRNHKKSRSVFSDNSRFLLAPFEPLECQFFINNHVSKYIIQHVGITFTARLATRGSMSIYLISPAGTVSCLLEGRPYDSSKKGYTNMYIRTNHFIGEEFGGMWTLKVFSSKNSMNTRMQTNQDNNLNDENVNELKKSSISLLGFRAVLVENLPMVIRSTTEIKHRDFVQKDFDLLFQWIDYRYSQLLLTNPEQKELNTVDITEVVNNIKVYTELLSKTRNNFNSNTASQNTVTETSTPITVEKNNHNFIDSSQITKKMNLNNGEKLKTEIPPEEINKDIPQTTKKDSSPMPINNHGMWYFPNSYEESSDTQTTSSSEETKNNHYTTENSIISQDKREDVNSPLLNNQANLNSRASTLPSEENNNTNLIEKPTNNSTIINNVKQLLFNIASIFPSKKFESETPSIEKESNSHISTKNINTSQPLKKDTSTIFQLNKAFVFKGRNGESA